MSQRNRQRVGRIPPGTPDREFADEPRLSPSRNHRHGYPRLRLHQRFVPLLVVLAVICTLGMAVLAYFGARVNAISDSSARELQNAKVARQVLADQGANLLLQDGHLVVGVDSQGLILNNDSTIVDRARSLYGAYTTIYQIEDTRLSAISTNLPAGAASSRALGDVLTGPAYDALLGGCGSTDAQSCHQPYAGIVNVAGVDYVAGFQPLFDSSGAFVGALGAATPLDGVVAPAMQMAVLLLLVGLLAALLCIMVGVWLFNAFTLGTLHALDARLDSVGTTAATLDRVARAQIDRASRQSHTARQIDEQARALDALATSIETGHTELRDTAGEIWAGISHPGAMPPTPERAVELARHTAVVSSRLGASAAHVRDLCRELNASLRHLNSVNNAVSDSGRELQICTHELNKSIELVEATLGEPIGDRPDIPARPSWISRTLQAFRGRQAQDAATSPKQSYRQWDSHSSPSPVHPRVTGKMPRSTGTYPAQTGIFPTTSGAPHRRVTGQAPRVSAGPDRGTTGQTNAYPSRRHPAGNTTGNFDGRASLPLPPRNDSDSPPARRAGMSSGRSGRMPGVNPQSRPSRGDRDPRAHGWSAPGDTGQHPVPGRGQTGSWSVPPRRTQPPNSRGHLGLPNLPADEAPRHPDDLAEPHWPEYDQ